MRRQWLYFCYRFHVRAVSYLTLSIPYVSYHSDFSDDFKVYSDSVFTYDLWSTSDIAFLTIPCVSHDSIFAIDFMRRSGIHRRCRFRTSVVTQFSLTISMFNVTQFSLTISGQYWHGFHRWFLASMMTLFSLLISCVHRELVFAVDFMRHPPLNFQWWFLVLRWLSFHRRFLHQQWHSVFDDSMCHPWLYFRNRCHASVGNSLTLSILYVSYHLVFSDDF